MTTKTVDSPQHSEMVAPATNRRVRTYDFQQQDTLDRGRLRRLQPVLEVLAHRMAGALTSTLRHTVRVEIGEAEQQRWETYTASLPEPTFLSSVTISPYGGRLVLHLPLAFALALAEVRLGGLATGRQPVRPLTDIEQRLVSDIAQHALGELPPAFAPVLSIGIGAMASVVSSLFLPAVRPSEVCLVITMRVEVADVDTFETSLCLPITVLMPILDALERMDKVIADPGSDRGRGDDLRRRLLEAPVEAVMCFPDIALSPEELLGLMPGDVVGLHHQVGAPLVLRVGGMAFCQVVATSQGKRLAGLVVENDEEQG